MKKILVMLFAISLLLCLLAGCAGNPSDTVKQHSGKDDTSDTQNDNPQADNGDFTEPTAPTMVNPEPELEKLSEQVYRSSDFSEGLAAVVVGGRNGRGCVINKKGEIVFDLGFEIENSYIVSFTKFINGYMFINGGIIDKTGEMTYPQDVGASAFYPVALEGGYIIAEVIEADYSSTKMMLGVMNTSFEWVVEPSEALHGALTNEYGSLALSAAVNTQDYYYNGYVYVEELNKFLNVKTGEVCEYASVGFSHPSFTWLYSNKGKWQDYAENIKLDLTQHENISSCRAFEDGRAFVIFENRKAGKIYFTLVNEGGEFLFEPIEWEYYGITSIQADNDTILVTYSKSSEELILRTYDMAGKFIAEFNTKTIGEKWSYSATVSDGVVVVDGGKMYSNGVWYYTTQFEPLF